MAARITKRTLVGFRDVGDERVNIKAIKLVEEATTNREKLIKELKRPGFWHKNAKGQGEEMKFNAVVGNPPYQSNLDSGRSLAKQLFPKFIEICIKINPLYWSLITPQKWFTADGQDNSFPKLRELIRADNHIQSVFSDDGKKLFPNTELGVVSYYLWDSHYVGNVRFVERGAAPSEMTRPLFEEGLDIILPQNKFVAVIKKVVRGKFVSLSTISTGRDAFGINGKNFETRSSATPFKDAVKVQCAYEEIRYVKRSMVAQKGVAILDSYKVFTSKGNGGAGLLTDGKAVSILGKAYVAEPGMACTDSLIPFGKFNSKSQAVNLQKYMGTKFLRFLVGILKVSQNLYQNVYSFVPLQDFTSKSDIDWSKGVGEIDRQLYAKYKLTGEEVGFIESMIKPME
jgi:hypothetical protein